MVDLKPKVGKRKEYDISDDQLYSGKKSKEDFVATQVLYIITTFFTKRRPQNGHEKAQTEL